MHQTFYIDIDEEITSVIERLRKAEANEAVIVVPKQAALIQSIVNLKLLKKEAERLGVGLILVTQDKLGRMMIEKAGIAVEHKLEDIEGEELMAEEKAARKSRKSPAGNKAAAGEAEKKIDRIGSDSFFDPGGRPKDNEYFIKDEKIADDGASERPDGKKEPAERIINKELVTGIALDIKKGKSTRMDAVAKKSSEAAGAETAGQEMSFEEGLGAVEKKHIRKPSGHKGMSLRDEKLENFFSPNLSSGHRRETEAERRLPERRPVSDAAAEESDEESLPYGLPDRRLPAKSGKRGRRILKYVLAVISFAVGCGALYAAYLYVPEATIAITTKKETKSGDIEMTADAKAGSSDYGTKTIPAQLIEIEAKASDSFSPSGKSSGASASKAHGKVTLYNEFSTSSQTLVATTRLEDPDGRVFRLSAGVTIPGMGKDGTPGSVEAYVTADQPGADYDIDPATFTIPGFKSSGSGKYSKFYAKSTEKMTGGDGSGSGTAAVTEADISNAKSKIADKLNDAVEEAVKEKAGSDAVLLEDAFEGDDPTYGVSVEAGQVVDSFDVSASVRVQAVVFDKSDAEAMANSLVSNAGMLKTNLAAVSVELDYGKSDLDLKSETLGIKAHVTSSVASGLDEGELKAGILGKTNDELESYLRNYPAIEKAEVTYWPPIIANRIPKYAQRVKVEINPD